MSGYVFRNRGWYTDLVDIYRTENQTVRNIDTQIRNLIASDVPCRVYSSQINGLSVQDTAARVNSQDKLSCDVSVDIRAGDELVVKRGGAMGRGRNPERYYAGKPQNYYDPVGGALTGLEHQEVGLMLQNIAK